MSFFDIYSFNILKENKSKNIVIQIHDDIENAEIVERLKELNKDLAARKYDFNKWYIVLYQIF